MLVTRSHNPDSFGTVVGLSGMLARKLSSKTFYLSNQPETVPDTEKVLTTESGSLSDPGSDIGLNSKDIPFCGIYTGQWNVT